jgi:hypothetical protein
MKEINMAKFKYTPPEETNEDRVYLRVDDIFDISILRTEEGLIIDVYDDNDGMYLLGTLGIHERDLASNREE